MEYRNLGKSGLKISVFSYGSWITFGKKVDSDMAELCMKKAYDNGITFFDNAESYEYGLSEEIMGTVIKKMKWRRDSYCVSSKVMYGSVKNPRPTQQGLNRKHIFEACHQAMKRLNVDYLDFYFCHRPDIETPIEETVRAMNALIQQGKVLYWGTSEWSSNSITEAVKVARNLNLIPPTMEQTQYNMFTYEKVERDFVPLYEEIGLGVMAWSPLASGILTGKYNNRIPKNSRFYQPDFKWLRDDFLSDDGLKRKEKIIKLSNIAEKNNITMAQMALSWCLKNSNISTVILGATCPEQLEENLNTLEQKSKITDSIFNEIETILK
jgi:voltage-dependent potassium channel beta subunit